MAALSLLERFSAQTSSIGVGIAYGATPEFCEKYALDIAMSTALLLLISLAVARIEKIDLTQPKRLAWVFTFVSAVVTGPASIVHMWNQMTKFYNTGEWDGSFFYGPNSRLAEFLVVYFLVYMILDLAVGFVLYRKQVQLLSGWIHHFVYTLILLNALKWNFANCFCCFFPAEFCTILLSMGHMDPNLRMDWTFGIAFLGIRVCYHGIMSCVATFQADQRCFIYPICWLVFALHLFWWRGWVKGMIKRSSLMNNAVQRFTNVFSPRAAASRARGFEDEKKAE